MKEIRELTVIQIRIFSADYIPYDFIFRKEAINYIIDQFGFQKHQIHFETLPQGAPRVAIFEKGECKVENKLIILKKVTFEERRILVEALASSKEATKFFNLLSKAIRKFDPRNRFKASDAVYFGEESSCVAMLDIDFMEVYSDKFKSFLEKDVIKKLKHDPFEIYPCRSRFEISFKPNEELMKQRISLGNKYLTIEPKAEHSLSEKAYYTASPCDTETHIALIEAFENRIKIT